MKKKKYLPRYYKWAKAGKIPYVLGKISDGGLCAMYEEDKLFNLFVPYHYELESAPPWGYWGCDGLIRRDSKTFTPLRQNIVLFLAAMNGEL